jgi:arylsulfatase A-like enzyme
LVGCVLTLVAILGCPSSQETEKPKQVGFSGSAAGRNLVLISLDTVRADRLGAYGYTVQGSTPSPRIDALLSDGVRFQRPTAPRAATWPSLATVLSGLYPSGHGVAENGYHFPDDVDTLPEILQHSGYQTGRFLSNMCNANHTGWDVGFCSKGVDSRINPEAFAWLDTLEPSSPQFLWVHYFGAHGPYYNGGNRAAKRLDPGYEGPVAPKKNALNRIMREEIPLTERDLKHLDAIYDASVMGSDRFVGELLDGLEERGLLDNSIVVFLADHGEDLYQHHGYIYHACSVYQSGLEVPLGFIAEGLISPLGVVSQNVELADVTPTILDLLGVEPGSELHGVSLVPYLARPDSTGAGKPAFSEFGDTEIHTVVEGDWKLIDNPNDFSIYCLEGAPEGHYPVENVELYNLAEDPGEHENVAADYPGRVAELQKLIEVRFSGLSRRIEEQEVPEGLKEELRALGYVAD